MQAPEVNLLNVPDWKLTKIKLKVNKILNRKLQI